jgi:hypothetical protein
LSPERKNNCRWSGYHRAGGARNPRRPYGPFFIAIVGFFPSGPWRSWRLSTWRFKSWLISQYPDIPKDLGTVYSEQRSGRTKTEHGFPQFSSFIIHHFFLLFFPSAFLRFSSFPCFCTPSYPLNISPSIICSLSLPHYSQNHYFYQ